MLNDLFGKKKSFSPYDSEEFKNKVKINKLQDKLARQKQREQIAGLQKQLRPTSAAGFLESMYGKGGMFTPPQKATPIKKVRRVKHRPQELEQELFMFKHLQERIDIGE